jgi:hypothetical protein
MKRIFCLTIAIIFLSASAIAGEYKSFQNLPRYQKRKIIQTYRRAKRNRRHHDRDFKQLIKVQGFIGVDFDSFEDMRLRKNYKILLFMKSRV